MVKNRYPGKFIVIEGLDGAGKSTQADIIGKYLRSGKKEKGEAGRKVFLTCEPTHSLAGGLVRSRLSGEWQSSPECLQLLFAADRAQHLFKEIAPKLKDGFDVVCDRYFMSSLAYGAIDCDFEWLVAINRRFLLPDLTIYLDVPESVCAQRIADNGKSIELFENIGILKTVALNYRKAIDIFKGAAEIKIINGNNPPKQVFEDFKKFLTRD